MKRKFIKSTIASLTAVMLMTSGCQVFTNTKVENYKLSSPMTKAQLVDYYATAMDYDSIVSRNVNVHETKYEVRDIEGQKAERLKIKVQNCEKILSQSKYEPTDETLKLVSEDTFYYLKGVFDNDVLSNGQIQNIKGALGYYFVDVEYEMTAQQAGEFKDSVSLVGLDGVYYLNYKDEYVIDENYLKLIAKKLDEYFFKNGIMRHAVFDEEKLLLEIHDGEEPVVTGVLATYTNITVEESGDGTGDAAIDLELEGDEADTEADEKEAKSEKDDKGVNIDEPQDTEIDAEIEEVPEEITPPEDNTQVDDLGLIDDSDVETKFQIITPEERRLRSDILLINKIIGSNKGQSNLLPQLEYLYSIPSASGTISGYAVYPAGSNGLKTFGFDRNNYKGKVTLRYVFKDESTGTGEILGTNIYCVSEEVNSGINVATSNVLVPDFLFDRLAQTIERSDRCMANGDVRGLVAGSFNSGLIYEDIGVGILRGERNKSTGITKYMSTIRQVVARNTANNTYLLDVETTVIEGPRDVDSYGTYKDRYYVVVQQQNDDFVITDYLRTARDLTSEPPIDPDTNIQKKLVALNLAGEIGDKAKTDIKQLMSDFYTCGTNKVLHGPKELQTSSGTITVNRGIYDCFTSDVTVLSTDKRDYKISSLADLLGKYGTDVKSVYAGTVTEWIGGYDNQAEFTTEELVYFPAKKTGYYMQVYYLVSVNNDVWVIDERTVMNEENIEDAGRLSELCDRLGIQ